MMKVVELVVDSVPVQVQLHVKGTEFLKFACRVGAHSTLGLENVALLPLFTNKLVYPLACD